MSFEDGVTCSREVNSEHELEIKEPDDIHLGQGLYVHKKDIAHLLSRLGFEPAIFNSKEKQ